MHGSEITQITIFDSLSPGNAAMPQSSKIMYFFFFFLVILILLTLTCPLPAIYLVSLRLKKKCFLCHGTDSMAPF